MEGKYASMEARYRLERLNRALQGEEKNRAIAEALQDESVAVRSQAISLAVRHLEPEVLGGMVEDDANAVLRNAALEVLERQGPYALPQLREMAAGENAEAAMFAVGVLSHVPDEGSIPVLTALLDHADENVVLSAIEALGTHVAGQAVPKLIGLMESSLWQQLAVIKALGRIGDARALPVILGALENEMLVEAAVEALGGIEDRRCIEPLWRMVTGTGIPQVRKPALRALARLLEDFQAGSDLPEAGGDTGELEAFLLGALCSEQPELCRAASTVSVSARLETLYPRIAARAAEPEETAWVLRLFRRFPEEIPRHLYRLLNHEDPEVRCGVLEICPAEETPFDLMLERLTDSDPRVRRAACRVLGSARKPVAVPALLERLRSHSQEDRTAGIDGLSGMPANSLGPLVAFLEESLPAEQVTAALAVVENTSCNELAGKVAGLLDASRREIRLQAIRTAGALTGVDCDRHLIPLLDDPDTAVQIEAIDALVRRGCPKLVSRLLPLLDSDDRLRYHVIRALGRLRAAEAAEPLRRLFDESCTHEQVEITSALVRIEPAWIGAFLVERFHSDNVEIRRIAAEALVRLPEKPEENDLLEMAEDEDWSIRGFAAWGLGSSGHMRQRETLLNLCRDVEPLVARIAREALDGCRGE